jgi:hypothetical protein
MIAQPRLPILEHTEGALTPGTRICTLSPQLLTVALMKAISIPASRIPLAPAAGRDSNRHCAGPF